MAGLETVRAHRLRGPRVRATGHYTLHLRPDMEAASLAMDRAEVRMIVQIAPELARRREVRVIADGQDPDRAQLIAGELSRLVGQALLAAGDVPPPIRVEERAWCSPKLDDRWTFVPRIMADVIFVSTLMLSAMLVVRERQFGTLERQMVRPVGRFEFLLCKLLPVACVGIFDAQLETAVAMGWFGVPLRGGVVALVVATLLLLSTQGLGRLASTCAATQQQAMMTAAFFIMPMIVLSGFAVAVCNFPEPLQWLSQLDSLRHCLVVIRDVSLKGGSAFDHPHELAAMALLGSPALAVAALRVR